MLINEDELKKRLESDQNLSKILGNNKPAKKDREENVKENKEVERAALELAKPKEARIKDSAIDVLMTSLGLLSEECLMREKPKDLAAIAASMSKVVRDLTPQESTNDKVTLVVYAPQQRSAEDYKTIDI